MCSIRWAFRYSSWRPSRSEWLLAARCVQPEEKDRIGQFLFAKDAKSAMAGRLLLRKFVCERMNIPWSEIRLERSPRGKPYLTNPPKACSCPDAWGWNFNLSHQGDYTVLAAEQRRQVGVDIMKTTMPGTSSVSEFFRIMSRQLTDSEWRVVRQSGSEQQQLHAFYRYWTLKESFIKAIGSGLGFNLQRVEFHISSELIREDQALRQTKMHLDEEEEEGWLFEESLLDSEHHVAVAMGPLDLPGAAHPPPPLPAPPSFTLLSFSDIISLAMPLTEEDPPYWDSFQKKEGAPGRQKNT